MTTTILRRRQWQNDKNEREEEMSLPRDYYQDGFRRAQGSRSSKSAITRTPIMSLPLLLLLLLLSLSTTSVVAQQDGEKIKKEKRFAIVTLVTTSTYIPGALVLAESLNNVNAKGEKVVLWVGPEDDPRSDLDEDEHMKQLLRQQQGGGGGGGGWDRAIQLSKKDGTYTECKISDQHKAMIKQNPKLKSLERYWGTCSKFAAWGLTDYDVVVYMDADSIAFNNFDFVFDYLDNDDGEGGGPSYNFAAHGVPECWDTDPPNFNECNFYTAFFVLKPLPHIQNYFHQMAEQQWLAEGEITLLNQVIQLWKPLPRFTLSAQTEAVRPTNPTTGKMDSRLAKVYDFAGSPETKPWMSYKLSKEKKDPNWHAYFGSMKPGTDAHQRYQIPQIVWNQYYDQVLEKQKQTTSSSSSSSKKKEEEEKAEL